MLKPGHKFVTEKQNLTLRSKFKVTSHYPWYMTYGLKVIYPNEKISKDKKKIQPGHKFVTQIQEFDPEVKVPRS